MARERKGYLLLAAFNPTLLVRGGVEKKGRNDAEEGERGHERGVGGGRMAARVDAVPLLPSGPISTRA